MRHFGRRFLFVFLFTKVPNASFPMTSHIGRGTYCYVPRLRCCENLWLYNLLIWHSDQHNSEDHTHTQQLYGKNNAVVLFSHLPQTQIKILSIIDFPPVFHLCGYSPPFKQILIKQPHDKLSDSLHIWRASIPHRRDHTQLSCTWHTESEGGHCDSQPVTNDLRSFLFVLNPYSHYRTSWGRDWAHDKHTSLYVCEELLSDMNWREWGGERKKSFLSIFNWEYWFSVAAEEDVLRAELPGRRKKNNFIWTIENENNLDRMVDSEMSSFSEKDSAGCCLWKDWKAGDGFWCAFGGRCETQYFNASHSKMQFSCLTSSL